MLMTPKNTTSTDATKAIRDCVQVGIVDFAWPHAHEAMNDEGIDEDDVFDVLERGEVIPDRNHPDRWSVKAPRSVVVVVELFDDPATVVVTVFYPDR